MVGRRARQRVAALRRAGPASHFTPRIARAFAASGPGWLPSCPAYAPAVAFAWLAPLRLPAWAGPGRAGTQFVHLGLPPSIQLLRILAIGLGRAAADADAARICRRPPLPFRQPSTCTSRIAVRLDWDWGCFIIAGLGPPVRLDFSLFAGPGLVCRAFIICRQYTHVHGHCAMVFQYCIFTTRPIIRPGAWAWDLRDLPGFFCLGVWGIY